MVHHLEMIDLYGGVVGRCQARVPDFWPAQLVDCCALHQAKKLAEKQARSV